MSAHHAREIATYAADPDASRGRVHDEPASTDAPGYDVFEFDRRRVCNSAAFRRLEYKTQAFVTLEDDHFRTRLTHTLEVAGVSRALARALGVNEALAETIALAHDLGHPPFGHAGEMSLRELMTGHGGFEHNMHSLRVVDYLEHPYPDFRGLNLTYECREGLIKHTTRYDKPSSAAGKDPALWDLLESGQLPTVEGQIACVADRIAYDCHDLEDAIAADLVHEEELRELRLWCEAAEAVRTVHPQRPLVAIRRPVLDRLQYLLLGDVIAETGRRVAEESPTLVDDVRVAERAVVGLSDAMSERANELEAFLVERVYRHHRLVRMDAKARRFITMLFEAYVDHPNMLPPRFAARIDEQGVHRVVCDYIAGMTDRYCQDDYRRLFEPFERV
ncbi:MAG: deoxyguanosinetriphosphate triphosphohydrolase [Phycisphaerales bacterium]|nr:deoxyguanosinetriphosphate triphosphohydrolase [Phycisphaerales bacterium]